MLTLFSSGAAQCADRIDWIVFQGLELFSSGVDNPLSSAGQLLSDHAPVKAGFRLSL